MVTAKHIYVFVFAHAKSGFSHDEAQISIDYDIINFYSILLIPKIFAEICLNLAKND